MEKIKRKKLFSGYSSIGKRIPDLKLYDIELIKQDLINHFMTKKGERVMNPSYGSEIWSLIFEPFNESIKDQIIADVKNVISSEPRVRLINLNVSEFEYGIAVEALLDYIPFETVDTLYATFTRNNYNTDSFSLDRYIEDVER